MRSNPGISSFVCSVAGNSMRFARNSVGGEERFEASAFEKQKSRYTPPIERSENQNALLTAMLIDDNRHHPHVKSFLADQSKNE